MNKKYKNFYQHNRNYGCRFKKIVYKGYKSLLIENEKLRLLILLEKGSDILEFLYKPKDIDFLWKSHIEIDGSCRNPVTREYKSGSFLDTYEGGWQEILPSFGSAHNYKNTNMGVHGELYSLPWDYEVVADDVYKVRLKLFVRMKRTPFFVEKVITIRTGESFVEIEECIINEGCQKFKFMWGQHPALGKPFLDENCIIDLPDGLNGKTHRANISSTDIMPVDISFKWPMVNSLDGKEISLNRIMSPEVKTDFRVWLEGFKQGWYAITNRQLKVGFGLKWDCDIFKYLFIWFSYGGWLDAPFYGRCYTVAPELQSSMPDNLEEVISLNRELELKPGEKLKTKYYAIAYEADRKIEGFDDNNRPILGKE